MNRYRESTYLQASIWVGAAMVGGLAIVYAKMVDWVQQLYFQQFTNHPIAVTVATPLLFLAATTLVTAFAPEAKGSGIPQVLQAIDLAKAARTSAEAAEKSWSTDLVSLKTAGIKVLSSLLGILSGASIGREGPTVQIAASGFAWVARRTRRILPRTDLQSYLVAGAAAGIAAAFNTPIAGITFAIEEIAEGVFGPFRQLVMLAVIIAGIVAEAILGDYLYFGHPTLPPTEVRVIPMSLAIGVVGGLGGGAFARLLSFPALTGLPKKWWRRALACGLICAVLGYLTHSMTAGSGYSSARSALMSDSIEGFNVYFPLWKFTTTVASYLSGMAGGIFSPCLSIGAGMGISIAKIIGFANFKACALIGMVAFFSGAVQAPFTAVVIVMEMTDEHLLILPFMISAFLAHAIGRMIMPTPLYSHLAGKHEHH